ncbi:MAG: hypothetical protein N2043_02565 [Ignavibacterium sp.]|nr:hypothetical protein [Ignavibacterium sp.]
MKIIPSVSVFIIIIFSNFELLAQRFIDRNIIINPLQEYREGLALNSFGEFGLYRLKRDNHHSWLQKLGIVIDFYKNKNFSFSGTSSIEFIADPHNDIRFNPRVIYWDEGFFITKKIHSNYLQIGYYHRCKHDVDNLFLTQERSLIYGSLSLKYLTDNLFTNLFENHFQLRLEFFTIKQDYKTPQVQDYDGYENLFATFGFNFNLNHVLTKKISFIVKSYYHFTFYSNEKNFLKQFSNISSSNHNFGLSSGIGLGEDELIKILMNFDYIYDPGIELLPSKSKLISFSLFLSNKIFR